MISAQRDEFLQRELTVVTRTQTKKQNVTNGLRVPSLSMALESHRQPLPFLYPGFFHHSLVLSVSTFLHKSNGLLAQRYVCEIHSHYCMEL